MTESEWLANTSILTAMDYLQTLQLTDQRRLRLFGCACCRLVWDFLSIESARSIVVLAEEYADGESILDKLQSATSSSDFVDFDSRLSRATTNGPQLSKLTHNSLQAATSLSKSYLSHWDVYGICQAVCGNPRTDFFMNSDWNMGGNDVTPDRRKKVHQTKLLRDIFGNPFQVMKFDENWKTETILAIAKGAYEERFLPSGELDVARMMILADALEEAGCDNEDILSHLRSPGPHVRGCWALDLVLGKT